MNQTQREYLINRINSIHSSKKSELEKKHIIKCPTKIDSDHDRWKMILADKVKPRKKAPIRNYSSRYDYYLDDLFDFSKFKDKVDKPKLSAALKKLSREVQRIRDLAMLGDCEQAVALLAELVDFTI
jgi:hypothetical protein